MSYVMGLHAKWEGDKKYSVVLPKSTEAAAFPTKRVSIL